MTEQEDIMLVEASDVTPEVLKAVEYIVDQWWDDDEPIHGEAFIEALCDRTPYDLDSYVCSAARKIIKYARQYRKANPNE